MKRVIAVLLALALMCGASALAEIGDELKVVNCNEYVTLREEPSTSASSLAKVPLGGVVTEISKAGNGFTRVSWRGQAGYILSDYLSRRETFRGDSVTPDKTERYNINLFLSNFTEGGFLRRGGSYSEDERADAVLLTEFAIEHCWYNRKNRLEWGEYFNNNNVRLPESQIAPVVEKYFDVSITPSHSLPYIDYRKGYYYWEETGGHVSDGFACLTKVEKLSRRRYSVWFEVYGSGENWTNDACYYTVSQAEKKYPYGPNGVGRAVINVGSSGLDGDRSDWHIERYTMDNE